MHIRNRLVLAAVAGGLSLAMTACGESGTEAGGSAPSAAAEIDCSAFPGDLLTRWGREKQLVLNLSLAKGSNLEAMRETTGAPDPETFRTLAAGFESTDFPGVEPLDSFDAPDVIAADLRKTADLLETALTSGGDAWTALSDFYTQKFFVHHNGSISYWLSEAGCA
ncbi:MAG: hypothetical protein ACLFV8_06135 [Alphaproteobacteria bacterium]